MALGKIRNLGGSKTELGDYDVLLNQCLDFTATGYNESWDFTRNTSKVSIYIRPAKENNPAFIYSPIIDVSKYKFLSCKYSALWGSAVSGMAEIMYSQDGNTWSKQNIQSNFDGVLSVANYNYVRFNVWGSTEYTTSGNSFFKWEVTRMIATNKS